MFRLFEPLPVDERRARRAAYRECLARRNGSLDIWSRTLSRREATLARGAPAPIDRRASFDVSAYRAMATRGLDRAHAVPGDVLLLLALTRLHEAFGFGSPAEYRQTVLRSLRDADDTGVIVVVEKAYDARTLSTTAALFGVVPQARGGRLPSVAATVLAGGRGAAPLRTSLLLAAEIVHVIALLNLHRVTREVLRASPALRDGVEERLLDVLTDAVGHVCFRRLCTDGAGLARAERILPAMALAFGTRSPELSALGAGVFPSSESIRHRIENLLPGAVRADAFMA